ncbi:ComF family protein [Paenibacillus glycanilyticus]|uniref:ComF family protein n=1 Tax=Paenibacillus glycanilyticus TaxID=126569 RepID=UPI00203FA27D|nr:ComF family protein [Paenibacillus glycanilyticus]MCM3628103.1 ComF family protein [Paenibacillus glycanilyticus]
MRSLLRQFFQRSTHDIHHALQWLSTSSSVCLFCGKESSKTFLSRASHSAGGLQAYLSYLPASFTQSLCSSCQAAIPWLTPIKCRICGRGITCPDCIRLQDASFIANRSAVQYSSEMREWLAQYKYRGNEKLELLLAQMMFPALAAITKEAVSRDSSPPLSNTSITPAIFWDALTFVPVSAERAEERGFNQAERFASILSRPHHIPLYDLLIRERHTEKQSFKTRAERMKDTRRLFQAKQETMNLLQANVNPSRPIRLLLIDDIYTTGSTIQACAAALHKQASKPLDIYALTWARS